MIMKGKKVYAAFIDHAKAHDRIDWMAMWDVLKVYGVGGRLMNGVKAFHKDAKACIKVNGETGESFGIQGGMRQGCVMSPWLSNLHIEMKAKVGDVGVEICVNGGKWVLNTILFADDTVLTVKNE